MINYNTSPCYFSTVFIYNYSKNIHYNFMKINYLVLFFSLIRFIIHQFIHSST